MIKDKQALSMYETLDLLEGIKETEKTKNMGAFIKKFCGISKEKAKKLKLELDELSLDKLKQSDVSKILDILPEDAGDLNKIFVDTSFDADETNKILDAIKRNK